jgi:hypothetical protein
MIVHIENGKVINKIENLLSDGMYVFVYKNKVSIINFDYERQHYQCIALGESIFCYHSRRNNFDSFIEILNPYSIYYFKTLEEFAKTVLEKKWVFENYL